MGRRRRGYRSGRLLMAFSLTMEGGCIGRLLGRLESILPLLLRLRHGSLQTQLGRGELVTLLTDEAIRFQQGGDRLALLLFACAQSKALCDGDNGEEDEDTNNARASRRSKRTTTPPASLAVGAVVASVRLESQAASLEDSPRGLRS